MRGEDIEEQRGKRQGKKGALGRGGKNKKIECAA